MYEERAIHGSYETPQTERAIVGREEPIENQLRQALMPEPQPKRPMSYEEQIADLTAQQVLQQHEIRIRFLDKGCVVSLGCKDVAFGTPELAMAAISEYVNNPKEISKNWREVFNMK